MRLYRAVGASVQGLLGRLYRAVVLGISDTQLLGLNVGDRTKQNTGMCHSDQKNNPVTISIATHRF